MRIESNGTKRSVFFVSDIYFITDLVRRLAHTMARLWMWMSMPIDPVCDWCGKKLDEFGALLFSPPQLPEYRTTEKFHCCKACYEKIKPK